MELERFSFAAGATPKWVQNTERTLGRRFPRTEAGVRVAVAVRVLHGELGLSLPRAGEVAMALLDAPYDGLHRESTPDGIAALEIDLGRLAVAWEAGLAAAREGGAPARGRPRHLPGRTARERAVAFGIDPTLLDAMSGATSAEALESFAATQRSLAGIFGAATTPALPGAVRESAGRGVPVLQLQEVLSRLLSAGVRFVVVGGVAARAHRSHRMTDDLDLCYEPTDDNRDRLVGVLAVWSPYLRGAPPGLPFVLDRRMLRAAPIMTLVTSAGWIDLMDRVAGVGEWADVIKASEPVPAFGMDVPVLTLPALIAAKRAANRTKDQMALPELEALLEMRRTPRRSH
ncbi:MAG: hypothetical protein ACK6CY_11915 [Gemmatimonadota bacterium]|jgi:hypothetical protein